MREGAGRGLVRRGVGDARTGQSNAKLLDIEDDAEDEGLDTPHQWLPGLETEIYEERAVCAGPMGIAVAYGAALIEDIAKLSKDQVHGTSRASRRLCKEAGAWTRASGLAHDTAERWSAVRVSPARGAETLRRAGSYRLLGTSGTHRASAQALERALARYGLARDEEDAGAWPLLLAGQPAQRQSEELETERARHPARAWAWVRPSAIGWVATAGASAREGAGRPSACPECVRLHRRTGAWAEVLRGIGQRFETERTPGEELARPPAGDIKGCAALIARALARANGEATLRWWPSDESFPRDEEPIPVHARCPRCAMAPPRKPRTSDEAWKALEAASARTGEWTGLIPRTSQGSDTHVHDGEWAWSTTIARGAQTRPGGAQSSRGGRRAVACGKGRSSGGAWAGAIAEFIERESMRWQPRVVKTTRASASALRARGRALLSPHALAQFSDTQMRERTAARALEWRHIHIPAPFGADDEEVPIVWVESEDLLSQRPRTVLVPRSWVFIGAPADRAGAHPDDTRYCHADSNGCAAGPTWEDAIARALCELVERDAFAIWWYNRIARPEIDAERLGDPWCAEAPARFARAGRVITLLDLTLFPTLPVVACVGRNARAQQTQIGEDIVVTSGCGPSIVTATRRALAEQAQMGAHNGARLTGYYGLGGGADYQAIRSWTVGEERWLAPDPDAPARGAEDHLAHRDVRGAAFLARALDVARAVPTPASVVDLTRPELNLPVAKVAAPALCHFWHRFGSERLRRAPREAGWIARERTEAELNPVPVIL